MSLGPYIKVNPNERPTEYLRRVQAAGSDGGSKITRKEAQEGYVLLDTWKWEKYKRLTTLPTQQLAREVRAIKEMQNLSNTSLNPLSPIAFGAVGNVFFTPMIGVCSVLLAFTTFVGIRLDLEAEKKRLNGFQQNQSQVIDTLETRLSDLDAKKAKGEITQADYETKRRKIIEEVIKARNP